MVSAREALASPEIDMTNRILVIGATGMLGQALTAEGDKRKASVIGVSRSGGGLDLDIRDAAGLQQMLEEIHPAVVINAAAITSLDLCEKNPGDAYLVNARAVSVISEFIRKSGGYLVQVSTDHYFTNNQDQLHAEDAPVCLVNEYARTKYAGECFALASGNALVVRTNIIGFRGWDKAPTFVEWALESLRGRVPMTLFGDFYTSSIDVASFSSALFDLLPKKPHGVLNLASAEVSSKKTFIEALAKAAQLDIAHCSEGSIRSLGGAPRCESLGLDVSRAEALLGYRLPGMASVIDKLMNDYRQRF